MDLSTRMLSRRTVHMELGIEGMVELVDYLLNGTQICGFGAFFVPCAPGLKVTKLRPPVVINISKVVFNAYIFSS